MEAFAAPLSVTVQVVDVAPVSNVGVQVRDVRVGGGAISVRVALKEAPFNVAVMVTVPLTLPELAAVNVAVADPLATTTEAGTVTAALSLLSPMVVEALAAALSVTVQVVDVALVIKVGVQMMEVRVGGGAASVKATANEAPFNVAVMVPVPLTLPELAAANVAVAEPAAMTSAAGTLSARLSLLSPMVVVAVAAALRFTVQFVNVVPVSNAGVQVSDVSVGADAVNVKLAVKEAPFKVAVMTPVPLALPELAAVNVAVVDPATTARDAGTVTAALSLLSATVVVAVPGPLRFTVQVLKAAPTRAVELQVRELSVGTVDPAVGFTFTALLLEVTVTVDPEGEAPRNFERVRLAA